MSDVAMIALLEGRYPGATRIITPTIWALLPIVGGWVTGTPTAEFRIDAQGIVYLRGQISGGAIPAQFATMPAGFEPNADTAFPCVTVDSAGPTFDSGVISVLSGGELAILQGIASPDLVSLDGIFWVVFA